MYNPSEKQLAAAYAWTKTCMPLEGCGLFAGDDFYPVKNAVDKPDFFIMDPKAYLEASQLIKSKGEKVDAVVHSHVYLPPLASENDRTSCEQIKLPYVILSVPSETYTVIEPSGFRAPLVGRQWGYGTHDCFSLARDAIEDYAGVKVPDIDREDWEWWKKGKNLIEEHFGEAGFIRLPQGSKPQHCDVFGMQIASPVVNHLGVFLEPDVLLHQLQGRLSVREVYGGIYLMATVLHLRHRIFFPG